MSIVCVMRRPTVDRSVAELKLIVVVLLVVGREQSEEFADLTHGRKSILRHLPVLQAQHQHAVKGIKTALYLAGLLLTRLCAQFHNVGKRGIELIGVGRKFRILHQSTVEILKVYDDIAVKLKMSFGDNILTTHHVDKRLIPFSHLLALRIGKSGVFRYDIGLDLYNLKVEELAALDRLGEKSAMKIVGSIKDSKNREFERVVYALSIPNVGETTSKRLARAVGSMRRLREMTVEELTVIPDIGPIIAQCIYDYLREPENVKCIEALEAAGVNMEIPEDQLAPKGDSLEGKTIVISGTFTHHSREEYKNLIEQNGGKNVGSISKKTSFVLAGENMGPAKRQKCEQLGVPLVSEDEFLEMIK